jgi:hypothetical protein
MKIGVYKVYPKEHPEKFHIIGTANIENYWSKIGDEFEYSLIRECHKSELGKFEKHFKEKFKEKAPKKKVIPDEPPVVIVDSVLKGTDLTKAIERAIIPEVKTEKAIIPVVKKPRKKRVTSKSKK